ncbi:acyltransferase [Henriciella algicola]|uniref:Acyltransferase n=1 Tax=Henriciella algicola TaxID=1608422 RepID=A0A399RKE8_9PROT|nr:acyltransferase [Henriciella algicola]RIJ32160.1 acyltransferase [Henriciella algicola]
MRGALYPDDHAFAEGLVYPRVASLSEAAGQIPGNEADAQRLLDVWNRFSKGAVVDDNVKLGIKARLINGGAPENVRIHGPTAIRGILKAEGDATIQIGKYTYVGDDTILSASQSITIGQATLLAHGVQLFDNDSHPTHADQREIQFRRMLGDKRIAIPLEIRSKPIVIGSRCWIGLGSAVMKGVTIGDDTVVAAQSVVTSDLPAGVVAAGNPAKVVRELRPEERRPTPNPPGG